MPLSAGAPAENSASDELKGRQTSGTTAPCVEDSGSEEASTSLVTPTQKTIRSRGRSGALWLCWLVVGCSTPRKPIAEVDAQALMAQADQAFALGDAQDGVRHLIALRKRDGLTPDLRERTERQLIETGYAQIEQLSGDSSGLDRIFRSDYPERVRVRAGILAAKALFEQDHPVSAFEQLKKVDRRFPHHSERAMAGDVLGQVGLHLIERKGRYSLFFRYRPKGTRALEYLVLHYPLDPRCDDAYYALSQYYESIGELDYALEQTEDLLIYHPSSPYAIAAQARLPYLRLLRLERNDYDRNELTIAAGEIRNWLSRHPGSELEGWVDELARVCATRLVESDLSLARYYERIDSLDGLQWHARRALALALDMQLERQAELARALLAPEERIPDDIRPRPAGNSSAPLDPASRQTP